MVKACLSLPVIYKDADGKSNSSLRKVRSFDFSHFVSVETNAEEEREKLSRDVSSKLVDEELKRAEVRPLRKSNSSPKLTKLVFHDNSKVLKGGPNKCGKSSSSIMKVVTGKPSKLTMGLVSVVLLVATIINSSSDTVDAKVYQRDNGIDRESFVGSINPSSFSSSLSQSQEISSYSSFLELLNSVNPFGGSESWSMLERLRNSLYHVPRGGSEATNTRINFTRSSKRQKQELHHQFSLSDRNPFVSMDQISQMNLSDLAKTFDYAVKKNRIGFNEKKFFDLIHSTLRPILASADSAVAKSRGKSVAPPITAACDSTQDCQDQSLPSSVGYGDVDALQFCAAMRLFAEWRIVRQVPQGYRGYAVGMNLGQKDIVQNILKIEKAAHEWINHRSQVIAMQQEYNPQPIELSDNCRDGTIPIGKDCQLTGPTLRDLLEYEAHVNLHPNLPRLKERSAAMGLLWLRRQLQYQTAIFANILKVPEAFPTAYDAVSSAYLDVYGTYHGWAIQKIFQYSFQAAPQAETIYKIMNPRKLEIVLKNAQRVTGSIDGNSADSNVHTTTSSPLSSVEPTQRIQGRTSHTDHNNIFEQIGQKIHDEWDKFARHIGGEWNKIFSRGESGKVHHDQKSEEENDRLWTAEERHEVQREAYIVKEMSVDAHQKIREYMRIVNPLLKDLEGLFGEFNMNDPTRV